MKAKKTIAALTSLMIAVLSVSSLPLAVCANEEESVPAAVGEMLTQADTPTVVSAAEYAILTDEQKTSYASVEASGNNMFVTYLNVGDSSGNSIPNGSYVKKGTIIYFCISAENFDGSQIVLRRNSSIDDQTLIDYFIPCTDNSWCYVYTVANDDVGLIALTSDVKCPTMISADEYYYYETAKKVYYAKANIQSPAYIWIGDDYTGYRVPDGYYVLKGADLWIAMRKIDYAYYEYSINGDKVDPVDVDGNYGMDFKAYPFDNSVNVTVQQTGEIPTASLNFGSGIAVWEFPYSDGISGNEEHIVYNSGDKIKNGSIIRVIVSSQDYAGKVLKINGITYNMFLNGDGDNYLLNYTVPSDVLSVDIRLETVQDNPSEPSTPSRPSAPPITPVISTPTQTEGTDLSTSENAGNIPSETEAVKIVGKSHKSSITYNAAQAGVTEDILKAFSDNRYAKTLTAKFDRFKVKIDKTDIEDVNELKDIDLSISEKTVISQTQIKKLSSLKNSKKIVQLNFNSSEDIGSLKEIGIQANVGKKLSGETAVIYERKGKKLVKVGSAKVKVNGYVCFDTDHLGQFVVAIR